MTLYSDALEQEHPQECNEIRKDEFKKTIFEFRQLLYEFEHGRKPVSCCKNMYECKWEEKNETNGISD